jgi:hypothetical protein
VIVAHHIARLADAKNADTNGRFKTIRAGAAGVPVLHPYALGTVAAKVTNCGKRFWVLIMLPTTYMEKGYVVVGRPSPLGQMSFWKS